MFTLYDDGDDDAPTFKFIPLEPLLFVIELLLLLLVDFFSLRPFPFESPLFCRELLDDDPRASGNPGALPELNNVLIKSVSLFIIYSGLSLTTWKSSSQISWMWKT